MNPKAEITDVWKNCRGITCYSFTLPHDSGVYISTDLCEVTRIMDRGYLSHEDAHTFRS